MEAGLNEIRTAEEQCGCARALVLTEDGMHLTAFWSRMLCGCGLKERFDPVFVMENVIPLFDETFNYRVVDTAQWRWTPFQAAFYNPVANEILIRGDVYAGALDGSVMDTITVAHEVVHCIQSIIMRFLRAMQCVEFKTELCRMDSAEMEHHELQTDRITALVMSPERLTAGRSDEEIVQKYFIDPLMQFVCGVIKMVGREFLDSLSRMSVPGGEEVEPCAV